MIPQCCIFENDQEELRLQILKKLDDFTTESTLAHKLLKEHEESLLHPASIVAFALTCASGKRSKEIAAIFLKMDQGLKELKALVAQHYDPEKFRKKLRLCASCLMSAQNRYKRAEVCRRKGAAIFLKHGRKLANANAELTAQR